MSWEKSFFFHKILEICWYLHQLHDCVVFQLNMHALFGSLSRKHVSFLIVSPIADSGRDLWESTCSIPSGIHVLTSYWRVCFLFQTITVSSVSNHQGVAMDIGNMAKCHNPCIVCCKNEGRVDHNLWWRNGRVTCYRTNLHLPQLKRSNFWLGLMFMQP